MRRQDLVSAQEVSDDGCTLQGIGVQSGTVGRLAFTRRPRVLLISLSPLLFTFFYLSWGK